MDNKATRDFTVKFDELNVDNQKYIIAIQQALMFAQSTEKAAKEKVCDRASKTALPTLWWMDFNRPDDRACFFFLL